MKVAFSGSHGTGKTSSMLKYASKEKLNQSNEIAIITEVARQCPFPINETSTAESQLWMFSTHLKTELEYSNLYSYIISDRSLVDYVAYAYFVDKDIYEGMFNIASKYINSYDKIYFKTIEKNKFLTDDGVRSIDIKFQKDIENKMIDVYDRLHYDNIIYI